MAEHDNHDRRLEETLDAMLKAYSDEQPRPGLETRVLANLRAEAGRNEGRMLPWRWVWSGAVALSMAAVILAIYLSRTQTLPTPPSIAMEKAPAVAPVPTVPLPIAPLPSIQRSPYRENARLRPGHPEQGAVLAAATPRQEMFPAPSALSDQEKLLLRYIRGTPEEEVAGQSRRDVPLPELGGPLPPQVREIKSTEEFNTR